MYQIIFDFINGTLLNVSADADPYAGTLCLILTHCSIILIFVFCVMSIIWAFKIVVGAFRL